MFKNVYRSILATTMLPLEVLQYWILQQVERMRGRTFTITTAACGETVLHK